MINIVYMATPEIAVKSLEELYKNSEINLLAVVTQPDRPKGRGNKVTPPPVKVFAMENNIPCYQTEKISKDIELIEILKNLKPDFFVTFAFGQILSQEVLDIPKYSTINLHASLLPKYRGANPIQRCIYNGDICETQEITITENMTDIELKEIICQKSPKLICSTLKGLYTGELIPKKQCSEGVTIAKKFNKQDGLIDWKKNSESIHNQVRSMVDFPCAYTMINNKIIKILETRLTNKKSNLCCGTITSVSKDGIEINTGEGCILITKVKPESKGIMKAFDFANGAKIKANMKVGE